MIVLHLYKCIHLFWSFSFDKLLIDALGPRRQFSRRGHFSEFFAGHPKLQVFLTIFGFQEDLEGYIAVCDREGMCEAQNTPVTGIYSRYVTPVCRFKFKGQLFIKVMLTRPTQGCVTASDAYIYESVVCQMTAPTGSLHQLLA